MYICTPVALHTCANVGIQHASESCTSCSSLLPSACKWLCNTSAMQLFPNSLSRRDFSGRYIHVNEVAGCCSCFLVRTAFGALRKAAVLLHEQDAVIDTYIVNHCKQLAHSAHGELFCGLS